MKKVLAATLAIGLLALAGTAMADTFYERFDDNVWFNRNNTSHTWTFDLDNDALQTSWIDPTVVDINSWDIINSAEFRLLFYDDLDGKEYGNVINNDSASTIWAGEVDWGLITADVSAQLLDHTLSVTVNRTQGDFGVSWTRLSGTYTEGTGPAPVPEPATMLLFGTGLIGLIGYSRKRGQKS